MANYNTLKTAVADVIKTNGNNEITGALLQQTLLAIIDSLGSQYQFAGKAVEGTTPGTVDAKVAYLAGPGTYANFGGAVIPEQHIGILYGSGSSWNVSTIKVSPIAVQFLVDDIIQLYDGSTPVYPRTREKAVYFGNDTNDTLDKHLRLMESKTERIPLTQEPVEILVGTNVLVGYVASSGVIGGTGASLVSYSHLEVDVTGKDFVKFLGGVMQSGASSPRGYAFYDSGNNVIQSFAFEIGTGAQNTTKDYFVPVPTDAKYFRTCIKDVTVDFGITVDNFYCYLCTGKDVKKYVDTEIQNAPFVKTADIVNNMTTGGASKVLSAEQGKTIGKELDARAHEFTFTPTTTNQRITALDNLLPGSRIYRYPEMSGGASQTLRYYYTLNGVDSYKNIRASETLVIGESGETMRYFSTVQANLPVHLLVNQTNVDSANNKFSYNSVGFNNIVGHHTIFNVVNLSVSTTSGTDIYFNAIPKIPKGAIFHIDFADSFSSWLNRYRVYLNDSSSYTNYSGQKTTFVASEDITAIRVRIANADIISGQTPPNISVEMWWEDIGLQFAEMKAKTTPLLNVSKQSFIDSNPSGYDSVNDKFAAGEYTVDVAPASNVVALVDMICNYIAKFTSSGTAYPYIQLYYSYGAREYYWKYPIGGNGFYKMGQCKLMCPGTEKFNSPWNANLKITITVPSGCELYIQNVNAEYSNSFVNKNAFKVFQHGAERQSDSCTRTNWDLWTHIANYGAIVIPKRTTDGRWVCYHDDNFESDELQVIGNPSAQLPATSMQACTFAETQTLEYKILNRYGDHDTIPLLSEFFAKCSQMGVHPALSCHPTSSISTGWTFDKWSEVKEMARKYRVLDKLTIKSSYGLEAVQNFYAIFGNDIESYIADVSSEPTQATIEELAGIGWDLNKVKVGFELVAVNSYFGDATIAAIEAANLIHGIAPGANSAAFYKDAKTLKELIEKGCYEITADQFYSNGLNWA